MGATIRAAALILLASCSVPLDGGKCTTDQNCTSSERCSAGTCVACVPDPTCTADGSSCTDATTVRHCQTNYGGCRYGWVEKCDSQGKLCGTTSGSAACECPPYAGATFNADSDLGSPTDALPYATGADSPPDCRIRTLTQALAKATAATPPATVRATGWSAGEKAFSKAKGETFPLEVRPNVTLTTSDPIPAPGHYAIVLDDVTAPAAVNLHEGGNVSGLVVRSTTGVGDGIALACGTATPQASITSVDVEGAGKLQYGVDVKGTCGAAIADVTAAGATSAALVVNSATSTVATTVTGGKYEASATGVKILQGSVTLAGTEVASNTSASASGVGLRVGDGTKDVTVVATGLSIHDNDDTGLIVQTTPTSSVTVTGATIRSNKGMNQPSQYGPAMSTRQAGGVLLWSASPGTFIFQNNKVYSNGFDQVGVYENTGSWNLGGGTSVTACNVTSNTFTCRDVANSGFAVYSTGASVAAGYDFWQNDPPIINQDVNGPVNAANSCGVSTTITCP
jgi:hypothetical protein